MNMANAVPEPDDDRPVDEEPRLELPDRLDPPLDAAEADVVDQLIEVPADDDED